jgi:tartrate-resistant acid phosphatase type 5
VVSVLMLNSNRPKFTDAQWGEQLAFIERELADRKGATWMVACAHHPLYSNGSHGDNGVLQTQWGPLFRKHKLDFYVAGHDHDVQHLQLPEYKTSFLLVGGGGATTRPMRRDNRGPYSQAITGFTHLTFTPELATITFVSGLDSSVLHQFNRTPSGRTKITVKGMTTAATTKPLQVIQGVDQRRKQDED